MELELPLYNGHPYFPPQKFGQKGTHCMGKNAVFHKAYNY